MTTTCPMSLTGDPYSVFLSRPSKYPSSCQRDPRFYLLKTNARPIPHIAYWPRPLCSTTFPVISLSPTRPLYDLLPQHSRATPRSLSLHVSLFSYKRKWLFSLSHWSKCSSYTARHCRYSNLSVALARTSQRTVCRNNSNCGLTSFVAMATVVLLAYTRILDREITNLLTYLLTYLLTPWSRVLLEKLTGFAANQEIPHILWNNP